MHAIVVRNARGNVDGCSICQVFDVLDMSYELNHDETFVVGDDRDMRVRHMMGVIDTSSHTRMAEIVEHFWFRTVIDLIILANTIYLVAEASVQDPQNAEWRKVRYDDYLK